MARKDLEDRQKLTDEAVSTDSFGGLQYEFAGDRDIGEFGGTDAPPSDGAEYVLVAKYREDGTPYQEQVHASEILADPDAFDIVAEESGGRNNISLEHSEDEDEMFSARFRSLRSSEGGGKDEGGFEPPRSVDEHKKLEGPGGNREKLPE